MLARHYHETKHEHWPFGLQQHSYQKQPLQRISKASDTPLTTRSEWQVSLPLSEQDVAVSLSIPFDQARDTVDQRYAKSKMESQPHAKDVIIKEEEGSGSFPGVTAQHLSPTRHDASRENPGGLFSSEKRSQTQTQGALFSLDSFSAAEQTSSDWLAPGVGGSQDDQLLSLKDEDDDDMDEDEDADPEVLGRPLTTAERNAARRKMKRFRLTHQQTRFLMSEFVKQPHPDAAHRDRLSREIPGLSPRQVQVWFQNRRAKIKRLNAEDRDRVIKMRAVPEDFDNIQALHSPYGAVHGLGPNVASPSEMGNQGFSDALHRPLMVDVRRPDADENLSPTGLTPAFSSAGFGSVGVTNTDLTSPLSSASNDRYRQYASSFSPSLTSITANQSMLSGNQSRTDHTSIQPAHQGMRPLQPLHLRDTLSRPRADSMQSPLRSALSWKGESTDYSNYQFGGSANATPIDRQHSIYHMGSSASSSAGTFDASTYSGDTSQTSPDLSYPSFSTSSSLQRSRAASATFPLSLDLRNQYRGLPDRPTGPHSSDRTTTSTQYTNPSIYTTSYPPAPLTAPINIPQPRGSFTPRGSLSEHPEQQMSAPSSATADFSRRLHNDTSQSAHTPMRDSFGGATFTFGQGDNRTES